VRIFGYRLPNDPITEVHRPCQSLEAEKFGFGNVILKYVLSFGSFASAKNERSEWFKYLSLLMSRRRRRKQ